VQVGSEGGPEAAARTARYAALDDAADRRGAVAVMLGHTKQDQAETVLLGLARGSGSRSLSGMPSVQGRYRRALLGLDRSTLREVVEASGLEVWDDPHNDDPRYIRARVRHELLPRLAEVLGAGAVEGLARSADLLRADADALDAWTEQVLPDVLLGDGELDVERLALLPKAVRTRLLRRAAIDAGCSPGSLTAGHVLAMDALVTQWSGQGAVALPGPVSAWRDCGRLHLARTHS
jgi:tRNA(Ile)-lysidine synthase